MQRKLFVLTFAVLTFGGVRCTSTAAPAAQAGTRAATSGIEGTTRSVVISGVPGGPTLGGLASVEFAVAPVEAAKPVYAKAIFVRSDAQGAFKVQLPAGTYWIGSKEKALNPTNYVSGAVEFSEMVVVVKSGAFLTVELTVTGYAP